MTYALQLSAEDNLEYSGHRSSAWGQESSVKVMPWAARLLCDFEPVTALFWACVLSIRGVWGSLEVSGPRGSHSGLRQALEDQLVGSFVRSFHDIH